MTERLDELLAYARAANIERLTAMLAIATDVEERNLLLQLLADEVSRQPGQAPRQATT